jgi:hypothetical protein
MGVALRRPAGPPVGGQRHVTTMDPQDAMAI